MKKLFAFTLFLAVLLTSCKKDESITEITPDNPSINFTLTDTGNIYGTNTPMTCDLFHEMYLSQKLDFAGIDPSNSQNHHVGTVKFNPDGTCTNFWMDKEELISWKYVQFTETDFSCNSLIVQTKILETGEEKEVLYLFSRYYEDKVQATRNDELRLYHFYPVE